MKYFTKIIICILAAVLTVMPLAACKETTEGGENPTDGVSGEISATEAPERVAPVIDKAEEVTPTAEKFRVAEVFSDNMVLQRDDYIRIWGTSTDEAGKTVCAEFMGLKGSAEVDEDGNWLITLDGTLKACKDLGNTLKVYGASKTIEYKDVLVGDVYMVLGQSNAALNVDEVLRGYSLAQSGYTAPFAKEDINDTDNIRIVQNNPDDFAKKAGGSLSLADDISRRRDGSWLKPTVADQALSSSAIGYFFAKQLVEKTNNEIPIGIIECRQAATVLAAFMTPEVAEKYGVDTLNTANNRYEADSIIGTQESRVMYNQGIHPFMNFTISGIIWYQGESDAKTPLQEKYVEHFTALMEDYRSRINQNYRDFPIFIMEFPACYGTTAASFIDFGEVRSYMGTLPTVLKNSFFMSASDLWKDAQYADNLHPYCKYEMAARLVNMVMPMYYENYAEGSSINYAANPVYSGITKKSDKKVEIVFNYVGDGLKTADGNAPKGVQVKVGGQWIEAESVEITGKATLTVSHGSAFTAVRYHAITKESFPENINLCNSAGLPMAAFNVAVEQ